MYLIVLVVWGKFMKEIYNLKLKGRIGCDYLGRGDGLGEKKREYFK